jgi:ribosomal protein S18 acetylase RimI-like enzyme
MMVSAQNDPRRAGTIWAANLDWSRPALGPLISAEFRGVGPDSAHALAEAMSGTPLAEILRRLQAGRRCYAAWVGEQIAAYGWVSFDQEYVGELNLRVRLLCGEAYIWDCRTLPAFRRRGLYSALLAYILADLEKDGLCRAWIGADLDNVASQRGIARAGFRPVADMIVARALAMRLVWVQERPGVPEPVVAEARRVFLDNRDAVWLRAMELLKDTAQAGAAQADVPIVPDGLSEGNPLTPLSRGPDTPATADGGASGVVQRS